MASLLPIFVINLARRADRLRWISGQLGRLGRGFIRIEAVDGSAASAQRLPATPEVSSIEFACFLSHRRCWEAFLETDAGTCLVLEDDVALSPSLGPILDDRRFCPRGADAVRLETFQRMALLTRRPAFLSNGFGVHALHSTEWGAGAYLLDRRHARRILDGHATPFMPVDHILFNPASKTFRRGCVFQVNPAPCMQGRLLPDAAGASVFASDIRAERRKRIADGERTEVGSIRSSRYVKGVERRVVRLGQAVSARYARYVHGRIWTQVRHEHANSPVSSSPLCFHGGQQEM